MKVKFTKLAALLLAGVALFATGCTDYEVDIQKVDKKVDNLTTEVNNKIASLEQQIAGINATIATLETKADHDKDIAALNNTISTLEAALRAALDTKVDKDVYNAKMTEIAGQISDLEAADELFKGQIADIVTELAKKVNQSDFDQAVVDLTTAINGEINRAKAAEQKLQEAIDEIKDTTIPALQAQIDDINNVKIPALQTEIENLKSGKLDKSEFEAYKTATAATIALMQQAIQNLADTKLDKTEFDTKVAEILAKFDDYVLKTTFDAFKAIVGTEKEIEEFQGTVIGRLTACEKLLAGEWGTLTVKEYIDAKAKGLQDQLDLITNEDKTGRLDILEKAEADLEKLVKETILPQVEFALDFESEYGNGLQGYIDDGDAWALEEAKKYTDSKIKLVMDAVYDMYYEIYDVIRQLATRIQSIVYVPDYDDLKITSNMAKTTVPGVEGALYIDQPTTITYKILPAEYAAAVADNFEDLLVFDVKTVNTRADVEPAVEPAFQIIAAEKDANIDENGLVTFTVLPVNVASAAFAATAIPVEFNAVFGNVANVFGFDVPYLWADGEYVYPVVKEEDLEAYLARTAFAASLRFATKDIEVPVTDHRDGDVEYSQEWNEVASTYNVLYPGISHIVDVPANSFKKLDDGSLREFTEDERHLKLPYNSPDTKIILDQAVAGYVIDGDLMSYEQASEAGIVVPKYDIQFPGDVTYIDNNGKQKKEDYIVGTDSYVTVNMNLDAEVADRMFEIGNLVAATYTFKSEVGEFTDEGDVIITKELGSIAVSADAVWTWDWNKDGVVELDGEPVNLGDALIDHNLFYGEDGPTDYVRMVWPVTIDEAGFAKLQDDLGIELKDFAGLTPNEDTFKIEVADRLNDEGEEIADEDLVFEALADDATFEIANVAIKDGKLFADFLNFEWDKVYKVTAEYELQFAVITVNGIFKTYDRNREPVTLNKFEYTFGINEFDEESGNGYKPGENGNPGYYYWKSEPMHKDIFEVFDAEGVINVLGNVDFEFDADQEAFNEDELNSHIRAYYEEPGPGTAFKYVDINRNGIYAVTKSADSQISAKDLLELNTGEQDPDDPYVFLGKVITRYITTYIGEVVEIPFQFNYRVPAYDFLHQTNYTFDDGKWYSMASPKYDVNKKSLKKYDVEYMNVPALAFNIVDKNKRFFNYKDEPIADDDPQYFYNDSLKINFYYTDPEMDETDIEEQSATDELKKYGQLWFNAYDQAPYYQVEEAKNFEHTVFYYRSTRDAIPMYGELAISSDGVRFPIPTSFEENNGGKYVASEIRGEETDYSNFELRAWKPFYVPTYTRELEVKLDEHGKYVVNVLEGLQFFDGREVAASTPLDEVKDPFVEGTYKLDAFNNGTTSYFRPMLGFNEDPQGGEPVWGWVVGDADSTNGYYPGVSSWDAYDLQEKSFVFSKDGVPMDLRRLIDIDEETYTMTFDYNSQIQFYDTATISFGFDLQSPWQKFDEPFKVNVVIKGLNAQ